MEENDIQQKSDSELVALTLEDQKYFAYLIDRYEAPLMRYIFKVSNSSREEAEDVLQESFIKIYYNLNGFDQGLKFSSWAYRIVHNQVISTYRKDKARPQGHSWTIDDDLMRVLASDLDTKRDVELSYLKQNIEQVFDQMDVKYREVLVLKFIEQKDYKEISDILQKPMGTVGTLINRAKKSFKKEADKLNLELY